MNSDRKRNPIYFTLTSVFLVASTLILLDAVRFHPTDAQCVQRMFTWSPVKDIIEYEWTMFPEFGFLVHSKWFDAALPEREAVWEEFLPSMLIALFQMYSRLSRPRKSNFGPHFSYRPTESSARYRLDPFPIKCRQHPRSP